MWGRRGVRSRTGRPPIRDDRGVTVPSSRSSRARRALLAGAVACTALLLAAPGPSASALPPGEVSGGGGGATGPSAFAGTTKQAREANAAIAKLAASAEDFAKKIAKDAWVSPLSPGVYRLTARFGQCSGLWSHCHTGLDFAAPTGTT